MKAVIDLSEVEDQLTNCKPGDEYTITFTVDQKTDEELDGTATDVEHLGAQDEDSSEGETAGQSEAGARPAYGKKVPKAILMIAK